ncbi:hypothetical protein C1N71_03165 [Agrococcus sp. SGAir0287]|nr:hypothetical protein C1N71_03165 [Agrococcus sp. SGAir0287]
MHRIRAGGGEEDMDRLKGLVDEEDGAATAEYVIATMAAVATLDIPQSRIASAALRHAESLARA